MKIRLRILLAIVLAALFITAGNPQGASTVIDFEGIGDSTLVGNTVTGLSFANALVLTSGVSLNEFEFPPHSGVNVASDSGAPVTISIATPAKVIGGFFTHSVPVTMRAYDAQNNLVATSVSSFSNNEALSGDPGSSPNEYIQVTFAGGISKLTITGAPGGGSFALDDLTVMPPIVVVAPPPPTTTPQNPPLTITSPLTFKTVPLGGSISATMKASGGVPPYTWAVQGTAPAGVSLTAAGIFTATPPVAGDFRVPIMVTDQLGISVGVYLSYSAFGITTTSLPAAVAYASYSQPITAAGGTQPYTYSGTGLPPGLGFVNSALGLIAGTPIQQGMFTITIKVIDAVGISITGPVTLVVGPPPPLTVPPTTLSSGTTGSRYTQNLSATGGAPPYSWSLGSGSLPPGLTLSATGTVSGTPLNAGSYSFVAKAKDSSGTSATGTILISIAPGAVTLTAPSTLVSGMVGTDYPVQLVTAAGGNPPYTFSLASGTVPAGLTLGTDGSITGAPTTAGNYAFAVTGTDSSGSSATVGVQLTIRPASADLLLSEGSLSYSLSPGAAFLPASQTVTVQSTAPATSIPYSAAVTPPASWLSVTPLTGSTPGAVSVSLTNDALALAASSTPYQATLVFTCGFPQFCQTRPQSLTVSLTVAPVAPQLTSLSGLLSFNASADSPQASTQYLRLQNTGGGTAGIGSVTSGASWLQFGASPGGVSAGQTGSMAVTADPAGLAPGYYRADLSIISSVGTLTVPASLLITGKPSISLLPSGQQFSIPAGGAPSGGKGSFLVSTPGTSSVAWTATVLPGANWLSVQTPGGTATAGAPSAVGFAIDPGMAAALKPGIYFGSIRITSPQVQNSPQDFQVSVTVGAAGSNPSLSLAPEGLVFVGSSTPAQTVQVNAGSAGAATYQATASTTDGAAWLSVSPTGGATSASNPAQSQISVNPAGLPSGTYRGGVSYAGSAAGVRTVNVTLVVPSSLPNALCAGTKLVAAAVGLVNNFTVTAARPVPISVQLDNDCGGAVANGLVAVTFSNGDPAVTLSPAGSATGLYSGTWNPRNPADQVTVTVFANASGFAPATAQLKGVVIPGGSPLLSAQSTVHVFGPKVAAGLAPGTMVQIYGSGLASATVSSTTIPLPTALSGSSVTIGGIAAPLVFVSQGQINAQIPFELSAGQQYQVVVNTGGALSVPDSLQLIPVSPGLAALPTGVIIAQHSSGTAVSAASPAKPGEALTVYAAGLGLTDNPVVTGAGSPVNPLARPTVTPTLAINSVDTPIQFAGLTPGLVGLYQINFQVPADAVNGNLSLVLTQGGVASNATILPVHN